MCAKVASGEEVALIVRDDDVLPLSADPKKWGAISGKAVVCNVPGTRLKHAFRHDTPLTKVHVEQNGLRQYGSSSKASTWAPLKSLHLKEALDGVVRSLVRGIEAGTGTRVRSLTSVWALR